jgi:hypothetical protein
MTEGYCLPQLFECDDGRRYVVKLMSNPYGIRALPNELIAYRLGRVLDLPLAPGNVVEIRQSVIDNFPELSKMRVQPGPHFGSLFFENTQKPSLRALANCVNLEQSAGMIVFDQWIKNHDRSSGNLILTAGYRPRFYMIDHASCFCGSGWSLRRLQRNSDRVEPYWSGLYERFVPFIDGPENPLLPALERLESLDPSAIRETMRSIPAEWRVSQDEFDAMAEYLVRRKAKVSQAVLELKGHFPVWNAG